MKSRGTTYMHACMCVMLGVQHIATPMIDRFSTTELLQSDIGSMISDQYKVNQNSIKLCELSKCDWRADSKSNYRQNVKYLWTKVGTLFLPNIRTGMVNEPRQGYRNWQVRPVEQNGELRRYACMWRRNMVNRAQAKANLLWKLPWCAHRWVSQWWGCLLPGPSLTSWTWSPGPHCERRTNPKSRPPTYTCMQCYIPPLCAPACTCIRAHTHIHTHSAEAND